ncbi:hypothetical protein D0Z07_1242 [Hyphodiscus hymeniophilus]|uniref:Uncharacterized protein n=1 Tax=Hyphodiscus hymeniophilus TaxID=353542 RepID=A0A9P6VRC8_9HELO|nr:hypothetical protein D0Z07_1242 [Hyphodiscus hymeniophilus]
MALGGSIDVTLFLFFLFVRNRDALLDYMKLYINPITIVEFAKAATVLFTILQVIRYIRGLKALSSPLDGFMAKPMIFRCQTSHTRLYPKTNSFAYSYLWVGIPVGWKGNVGGMLSADLSRSSYPWYTRLLSLRPRDAWHTVNSDDYLGRGHADGGLQEKLHDYLENQGINPQEYPHAYLLTAPRFLNYASNPVSIWNLYSAQKELKAFVLEVNNTFDERHIYFVKPDVVPSKTPGLDVAPKLIKTWPKDFYVSTFSSRAGNYSISATDPLYQSMTSSGVVNTTVTLKSAHASLVARIFSSGPALDPALMTIWSKTKFLMAWWWVGLATFPRTLVQALKLLIRRKMQWVFRPEPRRNTMPRHADSAEVVIERLFRNYLRSLVEACDAPLVLRYSPAGLVYGKDEMMASPAAQLADGTAETLDFKVLTPGFYSRLVHYSGSPTEAFLAEHTSATITLSQPDLLSKLAPSVFQEMPSLFEQPRFWAVLNLRSAPSPIGDVASSAPPSPTSQVFKGKGPLRT